MQVPGPDGSKGYGGMCFPKDTNAFNEFAKGKNKPLTLLEKVIKLNEEMR
jgi:UDP-glucose 6-dehydrogenase